MKYLLLTTTLILSTVGFASAEPKDAPGSPTAEAATKFGGKWGTVSSESNDVLCTKMTVKDTPALTESYKMSLTALTLQHEWENTDATIPVKTK